MSGVKESNGHKPLGLSHLFDPMFAVATRPDSDALGFDLDVALASVVALQARAPDDAFSSSYLGTEREGNGILIGEDGLVVTIGYLIAEADTVMLGTEGGPAVQAHVIAYDYETGFGLLRAAGSLGVEPLALGNSSDIAEQDTLIIGARGGRSQAINGLVVSKREFAGYWEYMLDEAIFTTPPHPHWSGAALLDDDGRLVGVGSLFVQDAVDGSETDVGNMFLPINLLKSVMDELLKYGRRSGPPRPWMGIYSMEALGRVLITSISGDGPAEHAGVEAGDVVLSVNGRAVSGLGDLYRKVWSAGQAGVTVEIGVMRDNEMLSFSIKTADRGTLMKQPRSH